MTAFVTGGGGFIGRHLVASVRTSARSSARAPASPIGATDAKARRELGYAPRDLEAGLSTTFG